jgi:hypothetical protein
MEEQGLAPVNIPRIKKEREITEHVSFLMHGSTLWHETLAVHLVAYARILNNSLLCFYLL